MASPSLIASLTKDVADGLRVWRTRDHVPLTDHQILERTRNIVANIVGNYLVVELPAEPADAPTWAQMQQDAIESQRNDMAAALRRGQGPQKPVGHGWSCRCDPCDLFRRSVCQ